MEFSTEEILQMTHEAGIKFLSERISQLEAALREKEQERFSPLGDNHHNAAKCPHCNPELVAMQAQLQQAREEIDRLKTMLEVRTIEVANMEKERDTLRAQVERLSAPVTDEEWVGLCSGDSVTFADVQRHEVDAILASRLRK